MVAHDGAPRLTRRAPVPRPEPTLVGLGLSLHIEPWDASNKRSGCVIVDGLVPGMAAHLAGIEVGSNRPHNASCLDLLALALLLFCAAGPRLSRLLSPFFFSHPPALILTACSFSWQTGDIITDIDGVDVSGKDASFLKHLTLGMPGSMCHVVGLTLHSLPGFARLHHHPSHLLRRE